MNLAYYHCNCGSDPTPEKIALFLGYGESWNGTLTMSITPTHIIVRGYSETTKQFWAKQVPYFYWKTEEKWENVNLASRVSGEMEFDVVAPNGNPCKPGRFPYDKGAKNTWEKSGYIQLSAARKL